MSSDVAMMGRGIHATSWWTSKISRTGVTINIVNGPNPIPFIIFGVMFAIISAAFLYCAVWLVVSPISASGSGTPGGKLFVEVVVLGFSLMFAFFVRLAWRFTRDAMVKSIWVPNDVMAPCKLRKRLGLSTRMAGRPTSVRAEFFVDEGGLAMAGYLCFPKDRIQLFVAGVPSDLDDVEGEAARILEPLAAALRIPATVRKTTRR